MHEAIKDCYKLTELLYHVSKVNPDRLSDNQYEEIQQLLEQREELLPLIKAPFTDTERQLGSKIVEWNSEIDCNIATIKQQLAIKIKNLKKKEQSAQKYNGYTNAGAGSYFLDKKN